MGMVKVFVGLICITCLAVALLLLSEFGIAGSGGRDIGVPVTISRFLVPNSGSHEGVSAVIEEPPKNIIEFLVQYRKVIRDRAPPLNIDKWFEFAQDRKCSVAPLGPYRRIYIDLERFREHHRTQVRLGYRRSADPVIDSRQLDAALKMDRIDVLRIRGNDNGNMSQSAEGAAILVEACRPFAKWLGDFDVVLNGLDEPRVLKRSVDDKIGMAGISFDAGRNVFSVNENSDIIPLMRQVCDSEVITDDNAYFRRHGFFLGPCSFDATDAMVPIFSSASIGACFADILIPNAYYLTSASEASWRVPLPSEPVDPQADQQGLWQNKQSIVQWRGSNTGGGSNDGREYLQFHRNRLVSKAETVHVDNVNIDIGFTTILQCSGQACQELKSKFPLKNPVDHSDSRKFKYLVDIDGNSFSQRFLPFLQFTQSLILKVHLFEDWITEQLQPMKHYLPIDMSLDNFQRQIEWARDHEDEAKRIAQQAQLYADKRLRYEDMQCYLFRLLLEYEQLLKPTT